MPEFAELRRRSKRFTFTAGPLVLAWCLLLFWAVGYAPQLMAVRVLGPVNLGFLFVWSQVLVAVVVAVMFVRHAKANEALIAKMRRTGAEGEK
jgi:uncharacterized membrane protein (DUF485 family)